MYENNHMTFRKCHYHTVALIIITLTVALSKEYIQDHEDHGPLLLNVVLYF